MDSLLILKNKKKFENKIENYFYISNENIIL